jgi:diguanylate cyclase (GGDEF)-like protein
MPRATLIRQLLVLEHDVLKAIATGRSLAEAMDMLCRRVEALAPAVVSSVLLIDADGRLRPMAGPSLDPAYSAALDGVPIGPSTGSCGTAAHRREEVDVHDIATDPLWDEFRHLVLPLGLRACWSSPILSPDGRPIGTFAFYYRDHRRSRSLERAIVDACVPLCAIAIEHERAHAEAHRLAYLDPLTELANRAAFFERSKRLIAEAAPDHAIALFYLDLDGFKTVNDTFGHWAGDHLLAGVGGRLKAFGNDDSTVARVGGDEFALLCMNLDRASAEVLGERLVAAFAQPFEIEAKPVTIRVSVGIAFRQPGDEDLIELVKNADLALYRAKAEGGGTYRFFNPGMAAAARKRRELEADLRSAIEGGEFFVVYQPVIDLANGVVSGCEALVRWRHPTAGLRMPAEFISLAEELGLIAPIGAWVLEEACRQAAGWPTAAYVAINLSAIQLRSAAFGSEVAAILQRTGLAPTRLQLEITESVLLAENPVTETTLSALRAMGIVMALDDFGTGYSSLRSVRAFRPDKIKIDKSFVRELGSSTRSATIVRAVIGLARNLGVATTAEGIESEEQARTLIGEGCIEGQGYYFARPMPAEEVGARLLERHFIGTGLPSRAAAG